MVIAVSYTHLFGRRLCCGAFFLHGSREQRRVLEQLRIGRQFAPVRILRNLCYDSAFELSLSLIHILKEMSIRAGLTILLVRKRVIT